MTSNGAPPSTPRIRSSERYDSLSLQSVLAAIARRRWFLIILVALSVGGAVALSLSRPAEYEATAQVYMSPQDVAALVAGTTSAGTDDASPRANETQAQLARVPAIARTAVSAAGVTGLDATQLLDKSSVEAQRDTDLLVFRVRSGDRTDAVTLVNAYANAFIAYRSELDTRAIRQALEGVDAQLGKLRAQGDEESALYSDLFGKRQQLATLETLQTSNAFLVRPAETATQVAPKAIRTAAIAFVAALLVGIVAALIADALDTRVRTTGEVSERLGGVALLGRLPRVKGASGRSGESLVTRNDPAGSQAEPYRLLRTSLDFATMGRGLGTVLVTSARAGEGKSTTAANLALALAQGGKRVCLVDLDLRRPAVHRLFDLPATPGLTDLTVGRAVLRQALHRVTVGEASVPHQGSASLSVITAGTAPPNPGEFVTSEETTAFLSSLQQEFEAVIVDAPPMLGMVDARLLSSRATWVLVVTRPGTLKRSVLDELERVLEESRARVAGFVTVAESGGPEYGYSYSA
jgi:capsular exopolysaccharide synthesis family protein